MEDFAATLKNDFGATLKWLSKMYREAPVGLCLLDRELRYVFINEWLAEINGTSVEGHLGRTVRQVLPDVAAGAESQLRHVLETSEPVIEGIVEAETQAAPGQKRVFQHNYYPVVDDDGTVIGVSCAVQDVTDRQRAEASARLAAEIIDHMAEGVQITRTDTHEIVFANPRFERMFGYGSGELDGQPVSVLNASCGKSPEEAAAEIIHSLNKDGTWSGEIHNVKKDGTTFWSQVVVSTFDHHHYGTVWVSVHQDITERKDAEEALLAAKIRLDHLLTSGPAVVYSAKASGDYRATFISANVKRQVGYEAREFLEDPAFWPDHIHPDDAPRVFEALSKLCDHGTLSIEYRFLHKDGTYRWMHDELAVVCDSHQQTLEIVGCWADITERRNAEAALRASKDRYQDLYDNAPDMFCSVNASTGRVTRCNQTLAATLGYSKEELIDRHISEVYHPDCEPDRAKVFEAFVNLGEVRDAELKLLRRDGSKLDVSLNISAVRDEQGTVVRSRSIWRDITRRKELEEALRRANDELEVRVAKRTAELSKSNQDLEREIIERKRVEEALRERTERYELIAAGACDAVWDWDVLKHRVYFSPRWKELRGFAPDDVSDSEEEWSSGIHPDDTARVMAAVRAHFAGKTEFFVEEYRIRCRDGSFKWILDRGVAHRDAAGHVVRMAGSESDITERKRAEEALSHSATRLQLATGATRIGLWDRDLVTNEVYFSPEWKRQLGYEDHEIPNRLDTWTSRLHPDDSQHTLKTAEDYLSGRRADFSIEFRLRHKDGSYRWIYTRAEKQFDDTGKPCRVFGCHVDITERKRAEEQLRAHQQRLKALVSQLTVAEERERRRIASDLHDNVGQSLALLRMDLAVVRKAVRDPQLAERLDHISASLLKTVQDTRNLMLDLSSPSINELGLAAAISEWLEEGIAKRHGLKTQLIGETRRLPLDDDERAVVFRNVRELLTNVVKHARARQVTVTLRRLKTKLKIVVQDDGVGFDPHGESRGGQGEGSFGLFSIAERMSDLGGSLEIVSQPGKGCRAILMAPLRGVDGAERRLP